MKAYLIARLREPSTYAGIFSFLAVAGAVITPEMREALTTAGVALAGVGLALAKDSRGP